MKRLNKKQIVALWIGFLAIVLLLHFPPPGQGQTEWPVFIYSTHEVSSKRQPNGQFANQYGWERPGLVDELSLPVILICVFTGGAVILLSTPRITHYASDPEYLRSLRNPSGSRGNSRKSR